MGGPKELTPNIDRLSSEGIRFTQFTVASPICSASRCGLMTGQFPGRQRITSYLQSRAGNRECEQVDFLDSQAPTFVSAFHAAGYATAHVGKWHLGGGRDVTDAPKFAAYGYDLGLGTYESPEPAAPLGRQTTPWENRLEPLQVARHDRTKWMVDQAVDFIRQQPGKSWLVNLWLDDTHTPFRPSAEQKEGVGAGVGTVEYRAVLRETDRQIGRLLDELKKLGQEERTLVLLAGDNGPQPSFDRARTLGLRGMKWSLYEGGLRTPLIVRWPTHIPAGKSNSTTLMSGVDVFPTLCQLAGVPTSANALDGEDMSPAVRGHDQQRRGDLFWEYGRKPAPMGEKGLRAFPYPNEPAAQSPNLALRSQQWKFLLNADGTQAELYDLEHDPREAANLVEQHPDRAAELKHCLLAWRRSLP